MWSKERGGAIRIKLNVIISQQGYFEEVVEYVN